MLKKILIPILLVFSNLTFSQDTFIKKIDVGETSIGFQVSIFENRIFILSARICDNQHECSLIMEIDDKGEVIWEKTLKWLDVGSKSMIVEDDIIYISGNHPSQEKWYWHHMSANGGDSLATYEIYDEGNTFNRMFNLGQVKYQDQYCIYGPGDRDDRESSLLYFVTAQGDLDTLIELFTTDVDADPWEVIPDNEGNLVAFIRYREGGKDRQRAVAKINEDKELTWAYFSEENFQNSAIPNGAILENDVIVFNIQEKFNRGENLRALAPDSTVLWQYMSPDLVGHSREFRKISTMSDGNILGVGLWGDGFSDPQIRDVPWIIKISDSGSKLWERVYFDFSENGKAQAGSFFDAVELADGSIIAVGGIKREVSIPSEILIARFDSEGCLAADCGVMNDVSDILSNTASIPSIEFNVYPNPAYDILNIELNIIPEKIEVYDLNGQKRITDSDTNQIDIAELKSGMYLLKVYADGKIGMKSFVKQK